MTEIGLIALPMTFIIITGGIDLSVASGRPLRDHARLFVKKFGFPLPVAIVFALAVGGLAGFVNGLVITRIRVPPLIMTIATLALFRGLAEGISQAHSVRGYPEWFYVLGQGDVLGVPTQLLILVILIWPPALYWIGRLRPRPLCDGAIEVRRPLLRAAGRSRSSLSSSRCPVWPRASPRSACSSPA